MDHCIFNLGVENLVSFALQPDMRIVPSQNPKGMITEGNVGQLTTCIFFLICGGFCHTLKWNSHGFTCVPHPNPPSHLPLHPFPLGFPSAPGPRACLMHPTWAGDLNNLHFYHDQSRWSSWNLALRFQLSHTHVLSSTWPTLLPPNFISKVRGWFCLMMMD